jgi:rhodanese-related sulfurtransferase
MAVPRISRDDLKLRLEGPAEGRPSIVDVRLKYPFEHSTVTLPGAIRLGTAASAPQLSKDRDVVLYDSDPQEIVAERAAADLIRQGYRVTVLTGGITEWMNAKLPTDSKPAPQPAPPAPSAPKG